MRKAVQRSMCRCLAAVALLAVLSMPRLAAAGAEFPGLTCFFFSAVWMAPSVAIDVGFAGNAIHQAASGESMSTGPGIAQVVIMSAKMILSLGIGTRILSRTHGSLGGGDGDRCLFTGAAVTGAFSASLLGHGIWALTRSQELTSTTHAIHGSLTSHWSLVPSINPAQLVGMNVLRRF